MRPQVWQDDVLQVLLAGILVDAGVKLHIEIDVVLIPVAGGDDQGRGAAAGGEIENGIVLP